MIVDNEFINKLKDFGLNSYEVKLWVALLSRGVSTAGELSDIANVPRSRTYDVLESLEKKGFIIMKIGKPIKYLAIEPDRVVDIVKKTIETEAQNKAKVVESIKESEILQELQLLHSKGIEHVDSSELSGSVKGQQNLHSHVESVIRNAEETVIMMTTASALVAKTELLLPVFEQLQKRNVTIQIATQISDTIANEVKQLSQFCEVRHTDKVGRFVLVDGQEVLFMVMDDTQIHPTYDVGIWVNTPFFTQALQNLFDIAWKEMKPVEKILKI